MTKLNVTKFNKDDHSEVVAKFLASQEWPFHVNSTVSLEKGLSLIDSDTFSSEECETYLLFNQEIALIGIGYNAYEIANNSLSGENL